MKIRPVGADRQACRQRDRRTYMASLIVGFRNFANTPKNTNAAKRLYLCKDYTYCLLGCDTVSYGKGMDISCHSLKIGATNTTISHAVTSRKTTDFVLTAPEILKACMYEGHLESKERFAIQRYLLVIGNKQNMQVL